MQFISGYLSVLETSKNPTTKQSGAQRAKWSVLSLTPPPVSLWTGLVTTLESYLEAPQCWCEAQPSDLWIHTAQEGPAPPHLQGLTQISRGGGEGGGSGRGWRDGVGSLGKLKIPSFQSAASSVEGSLYLVSFSSAESLARRGPQPARGFPSIGTYLETLNGAALPSNV